MHAVRKVASVSQSEAGCTRGPDSVSGKRPEDYARIRRIVKTDEFSSVFRLRPVFRTTHFVLYARPRDSGPARLGVVVAKRLAARAVTRNMIKRLAREMFRKSEWVNNDFIIRLNAPVVRRDQSASSRTRKVALAAELMELMKSQHLRPHP
jgi:ribonuclease P protein component